MLAALVIVSCAACELQEQLDALNLVNDTRTSAGLAPCAWDVDLQDRAQWWAEDLAARPRLEHSDLTTGVPRPWYRLGENVGYGPSIERIHVAYLDSPTHRENVLNPVWTNCAVGVAHNGPYTFTVQLFLEPPG
ncbi:MAG: CAP domain-containing protein [Actinomycetota bacterium]|nr:CAP domain-containing protein [Actinomycetota bacterium]